jgi:hypothetical protein
MLNIEYLCALFSEMFCTVNGNLLLQSTSQQTCITTNHIHTLTLNWPPTFSYSCFHFRLFAKKLIFPGTSSEYPNSMAQVLALAVNIHPASQKNAFCLQVWKQNSTITVL